MLIKAKVNLSNPLNQTMPSIKESTNTSPNNHTVLIAANKSKQMPSLR